jgi:hypothetical protein
MFNLKFVSRSYIEYSNMNPLWNSGHVIVVKQGKIVEHIFVNDTEKSADELIDEMKVKYNINKVKYKESYGQR